MTTTNTTTLEIGQSIVIDGEIRTIESIKGRWVKLDDDSNISRVEAQEGREEYLEDADTLGDELDADEDDQTDEESANEQADADEQDADEQDDEAEGYQGPMLRLRERLAEGAYSKAANGNPCCGDAVAIKLGTLTPAQVIRACIIAMNLPVNPYIHLNIGQQSMNLRNKLRGCLKREEFGFGVVAEAVEQIMEEDQVL